MPQGFLYGRFTATEAPKKKITQPHETLPCPYPDQRIQADDIDCCPCCGGVAYAYHHLNVKGEPQADLNWIECAACGLSTPVCDTIGVAKSIWNRRA